MLFMGGPFLLCSVGLLMSLLLARKDTYNRIVGALPGCDWVMRQRQFWGALSFTSRWHQVNLVSGAFLYPKLVIRKGFFDEKEMIDFPGDLRRRMVISAWLSSIGFLWLMLAVALLVVKGKG